MEKADLKKAIEDNVIIERTDVKMETLPPQEDDAPDSALLDLTDEQIERLTKHVFDLYEELNDTQRKDTEKSWEEREAQYNGEMEKTKLEFNLDVAVTKGKCDMVERLSAKAFLESDPKFASRLRPEAVKQSMDDSKIEEVQQKQEDYLDYQLDERINIESPLRKVLHQAIVLDYGMMKIPYEFVRKRRTRDEFYSGKAVKDEKTGQLKPEGLEEFTRNYPKAVLPGEEGNTYFQKLIQFKDVRFTSTYWAVVYDDPKPIFVDIRDFYCRLSTEGYRGLCDEQIKLERQKYTFWELKKLEKAKKLINVEKMKYPTADAMKDNKPDDKYKLKEHKLFEVDVWFDLKDGEEESHIVCWFGEDNKVFLGAVDYQYNNVECIYVPFFIKDKTKGMLKGGMAKDLTDSHIAQNAILNMMLTETYLQQVTTPVVRAGTDVAGQILSGRWAPGIPLVTEAAVQSVKEEIDFLDKPKTAIAVQLMNVLLFLSKLDDDRTGVNAGLSGKESPTDPNAPAAKTAMLLRQSGINIEDYINCLLPSFNKVGEIILQQTYQMSNSARRFRAKRIKTVAGGNPFTEISRDEMILESVIESRAAGFAFDKVNEKNENLAIFQILRQDPLVMRNPKAVHELVRSLLKSWSPMWKTKADKLVLSNEEFNQEMLKLGVQSLVTYMQALKAQGETTGAQVQPDFQEYMQMAMQMVNQAINPVQEEAKQ